MAAPLMLIPVKRLMVEIRFSDGAAIRHETVSFRLCLGNGELGKKTFIKSVLRLQ